MAEASLQSTSSPIIFDDPVTSLDYRRLEYVAQRCVELAQSRQVAVFTHNIWFATELLSRYEDRTGDCAVWRP